MNRRALIKALGSAVVLAGSGLSPVIFAQNAPRLLAPPEVTSPLFHVFGVLPEPVEIKRIFAADQSASVLVNSVAPKQMLGWPFELPEASLRWLSDFSRQLPVVGHLDEGVGSISIEQLLALKPNIIVAMGSANEHNLAQAKRLHEDTGITYVLVSGDIEEIPEQTRILGAVLGHQRHGQQLAAAAQEVLIEFAATRATYNEEVSTRDRVPTVPFDWLDEPASVNRLLGLALLSARLHNEEPSVLIDKLRHLFILYFGFDPGEKRLQELLDHRAAFVSHP